MIAKATLRYVRISPRKVRPVIALVKGKRAEDAINTLFTVKKKASGYLIDLIRSAIANSKRVQGVNPDNLYVSNLIACGGPQMKRFRAASMGRASMIRKRTSHITVELDEIRKETPAVKEMHHPEVKKGKDLKEGRVAKAKHEEAVKTKKPKAKRVLKNAY